MIADILAAVRWADSLARANYLHWCARDYLRTRRGIRGVRAGHNARRGFVAQNDLFALELEALP